MADAMARLKSSRAESALVTPEPEDGPVIAAGDAACDAHVEAVGQDLLELARDRDFRNRMSS